MIAHAKPEPEIDAEPTYNQLVLARHDFEDAMAALSVVRWPVASKNPLVSVRELHRLHQEV